jgi:molybdopterin-guanine dinucleotide biosynthesis protein A
VSRAPARVAGLLLTGGASRRLGTDKARLVLDGETLAARAERMLSAVCHPVIEVGVGTTALPVVSEQPAGGGPLAAIAAGGEALRERGHHGAAIVLAVDFPNVTEALLALLRDWPGEPTAVPIDRGNLQVACARYGGDALLAAHSLVLGGVRALRAVLDVVDADVITEATWQAVAAPDAFADVDTRADAARLGIELPG